MKAPGLVVRIAAAGALLHLSAVCAQSYRPESFELAPAQPALALNLSSAGIVDALNYERARELAGFQGIGVGKVGADRLAEIRTERAGPWVLYARFYVLNFQNNLGEQKLVESQVGFGRTGPTIAGRIYVGIRKRF